MKKGLIFLVVCVLIDSANAQHSGFYAGLNSALQRTWIVSTDDSDAGGVIDFQNTYNQAFGLDLGYQINSKMGIQTGIIYSQQGQKYSTSGNPIANFKTDLTYIKFPLLFCYRIWPNKKISIIAQGGFQLSMLSEAKSSRKNVFEYYSPSYVDVKDFYASLPIEFVIGAGLQYSIKKLSFSLLMRADYSLSDIEKTEKKPGLRAPVSNFTLGIPQFGIQYSFN